MIRLLQKLKYTKGVRFTKNTRIDGKSVIITGANTGIGKETAIDLARRGGKIFIACRDLNKGQLALKEVQNRSGSIDVYFMQLDLASMESIREFAKKYQEMESKLNILILNAGVMACPRSLTKDGFETQIGVNHLGHFLLTNLLLDTVKASAPSRIVVVSSSGHKFHDIDKEDLMNEKDYGKIKAYSQSKLANVLFARELSKRLIGTQVTVNSLHPGVVKTELGRYIHPAIRTVMQAFKFFHKTPIEGASTQIRLAVDPDLDNVTGKYFAECEETTPSAAAQNDETALWLWEKSEELTKLKN